MTDTNPSDPTDSIAVSSQQTSKSTVSRSGNVPRKIAMSLSGRYSATSTKPVSACALAYGEDVTLNFEFGLAQPMWVTTSMSRTANMYTDIDLWDDIGSPYKYDYGHGWKLSSSSSRLLLPPGEYGGYLEGYQRYPQLSSTKSPTSTSASMSMTFTPIGARISGPSGNGKAYASIPSATKCSNSTLTPKITSNKKTAKKIKKGTVKVNGKVVKKFGKVSAKKSLSVKVPSAKDVTLQITMKTKSGTKKVTSKYIACS